jgi:Zn finger protein HypA/HybF involved in hydrogenase expression
VTSICKGEDLSKPTAGSTSEVGALSCEGNALHTESGVTVECLHCGHRDVLTREALSRVAIAFETPVAAFIKRLRCPKCGSQSVRATRKPMRRPYKAS